MVYVVMMVTSWCGREHADCVLRGAVLHLVEVLYSKTTYAAGQQHMTSLRSGAHGTVF
jgi:hypothetical protein